VARKEDNRGSFLLTTDVAPEVETPTLVTQEVTPEIDATPAGDADPQGVADAAPVSAPDTSAIEAEADAWLQEQEGKGSEQRAPEPTQPQGVDTAAANEAIRRFREGYGTRQQRLDALGKRLEDAGYSKLEADAIAKEAKDILNEHHADSLQFAGYEAAMKERAVLVQAIAATVPQNIQTKVLDSLKPADGQPNPPMEKVLKAFIDAASTEAEARGKRDGRKEGFIAGRSFGERTQSSANSGQNVSGDPHGRTFANADALYTAWNNKELSRDQYRGEYKRLTGKYPDE